MVSKLEVAAVKIADNDYLISNKDKIIPGEYFIIDEDTANSKIEDIQFYHKGYKLLKCEGVIGIEYLGSDGERYWQDKCFKIEATSDQTIRCNRIPKNILTYIAKGKTTFDLKLHVNEYVSSKNGDSFEHIIVNAENEVVSI